MGRCGNSMIFQYIKLLIMIILTSFSQVFIKIGSGRLRTGDGVFVLIKSFCNIPLIIGMILVLSAPLLYFSVLSQLNLNIAFSFNGLAYIVVIILGRFVLKEKISVFHLTGGLFIFTGFLIWNSGAGLF